MSTRYLRIPYPEDLPQAGNQTPEEFEDELRFLVAAKLYELGRVPSGRAAEIAGIARVDVLERLGSYQISGLNYGIDGLEEEIQSARERAEKRS